MDSYLASCLLIDSADVLIDDADWALLWADALHRHSHQYSNDVQQAVNEEEEDGPTARMLQVRRTLLLRLQTVIQMTSRDLRGEAKRINEWACKAFRFTHNCVEGGEECVCAFNNEAHTVMLEATFFHFNSTTDRIEESPPFYYSSTYGTVVRGWNMLARFEMFLSRLAFMYLKAESNDDKRDCLARAKALPEAINHVARFVFHYMQHVHPRQCPCIINGIA